MHNPNPSLVLYYVYLIKSLTLPFRAHHDYDLFLSLFRVVVSLILWYTIWMLLPDDAPSSNTLKNMPYQDWYVAIRYISTVYNLRRQRIHHYYYRQNILLISLSLCLSLVDPKHTISFLHWRYLFAVLQAIPLFKESIDTIAWTWYTTIFFIHIPADGPLFVTWILSHRRRPDRQSPAMT